MKRDDKAFNATIDLIEICVEYYHYYAILHDVPRNEFLEDLKTIILNTLNQVEQEYYYDENDNLQVPEHLDGLRDYVIQCTKTTI